MRGQGLYQQNKTEGLYYPRNRKIRYTSRNKRRDPLTITESKGVYAIGVGVIIVLVAIQILIARHEFGGNINLAINGGFILPSTNRTSWRKTTTKPQQQALIICKVYSIYLLVYLK